MAFRLVLMPIQPPIQWILGTKRPRCKADLRLVPRSRIRGSILPVTQTSS
jgi:hypothetical protein